MRVTYSSNNSGGGWWLDDDDWRALEANGWDVKWVKDEPDRLFVGADGRFLGALATAASIEVESIGVAVAKWEAVTGERAADQGCSCCGYPHEFYSEGYSDYWSGHDPYDDDDYY